MAQHAPPEAIEVETEYCTLSLPSGDVTNALDAFTKFPWRALHYTEDHACCSSLWSMLRGGWIKSTRMQWGRSYSSNLRSMVMAGCALMVVLIVLMLSVVLVLRLVVLVGVWCS